MNQKGEAARILFAVAIASLGTLAFAYAAQTTSLIPGWFPVRPAWTYFTGAGHLAAGIGVLFSIYPWLAATMEAAMLTIFTLVVWIPAIIARPASIPDRTGQSLSCPLRLPLLRG